MSSLLSINETEHYDDRPDPVQLLNLLETMLMGSAALALFWPNYLISTAGAVMLAGISGRQWFSGKS